MGAKTLKPRTGSLYDQDFAVWTSETAQLLRAGRFDEVDIEHVAEEIEDMGKRDKRELHSRLTVLLLHLLKWNWQPNKQSSGWQSTIITQRAELEQLFEDSPSLRRTIGAAVLKIYPAGSGDIFFNKFKAGSLQSLIGSWIQSIGFTIQSL